MRALGQLMAGVGERPLRKTGPEEPVGAGRNRVESMGGLSVFKGLRQRVFEGS